MASRKMPMRRWLASHNCPGDDSPFRRTGSAALLSRNLIVATRAHLRRHRHGGHVHPTPVRGRARFRQPLLGVAPSVRDLRAARDPMVRFFSLASATARSLERPLLLSRPRDMKLLLLCARSQHDRTSRARQKA